MRVLAIIIALLLSIIITQNPILAAGAPSTLPTADVQKIIDTAKKYIGVPYLYGGVTPKGFDCSGYVQYIFAQNKVKLPRTADDQYKGGQVVCDKTFDYQKLQPGDLLFFATETSVKPDPKPKAVPNVNNTTSTNIKSPVTTVANSISHVGIYLGDKKFIDAETKKGIAISGTEDGYWKPKFVGARRVVNNSEHKKGFFEYIFSLFS